MYFASARNENSQDLFYAQLKEDGSFETPVQLNEEVNKFWEGDVCVSPDENYMIYACYGNPAGGGLFISFNEDGEWQEPQRMEENINHTGREYCPMLSPDGKYFFFTSSYRPVANDESIKLNFRDIKQMHKESGNSPQKGSGDIYWVDAKIIDSYRTKK